MGLILFIAAMAVSVGMVVYGVVTFTVRLRRQRRRRALASTRLNPADIEVMAASAPEPVPVPTEHVAGVRSLPEEDLFSLLDEQPARSATTVTGVAAGQEPKAADLTPLHPLPSHRLIGFDGGSGPTLGQPR